MVATAILKCILLAKFQVDVVQVPIDEYATATINRTHNAVNFEATVFEGRVNSLKIEFPESGVQTMSFSSRDYDQKALSTHLDVKNEHASADCEIVETN